EMQLRDWSRENVIERVLLRQEASSDPDPIPTEALEETLRNVRAKAGDEDDVRREIEIRMRIDRLLEKITSNVSPPNLNENTDYYRKNKEQFRRPELIHVAHIVKNVDEGTDETAAREAIQKIGGDLKNGESFEDLADRHSDCPGNRGDLGW